MKKYARIKNIDTGEILKIYEGQTKVLPRGTYELLDALPTNAQFIGEGGSKCP